MPGQRDPAVLGAIALGGAFGAPARYGGAQLVHVSPEAFPWATLWTNLSGSFALGWILALVRERFPPSRFLRPFVATGVPGRLHHLLHPRGRGRPADQGRPRRPGPCVRGDEPHG